MRLPEFIYNLQQDAAPSGLRRICERIAYPGGQMAASKTSFERLQDAGIIVGQQFSASDKQIIEKITDEEVDVLIKLKKKMGEVPEGKGHMRPNMPV
jgi:hypothetical protein